MDSPLEVAIYCQSLHGVGHHVRARNIAEGLAPLASVTLINGGRYCAEISASPQVRQISLPSIYRDPISGELTAEESGASLHGLRAKRQQILEAELSRTRFDVLLVEYFPFQRWESGEEILFFIDAARKTNPKIKVCCSVRDFPRPALNDVDWRRTVDTLNDKFQCVLIHGDPMVCAGAEAFSDLADIRIPVHFTGYISANGTSTRGTQLSEVERALFRNGIGISVGGGAGSGDMILTCIEAWRDIVTEGKMAGRTMVVCLGPHLSEPILRAIRAAVGDMRQIQLLPFSENFREMLELVDLSISHAGYNTCIDLMNAGVPSILIPATDVSDQHHRAGQLASRGLARVLSPVDLTAGQLKLAIEESIGLPRFKTEVKRDGIAFMQSFLQGLTR